jgi:amino acid transporter
MKKSSASPDRHKLGELAATAICGNDITSSCLYVSALALLYGGRWGPLALVVVAAVLYLYRAIYAEVVGALPLNGGTYNALLNTTSKFRASVAACLTILSYMATAVISANEAIHYVHNTLPVVPILPATVLLLALFTGLTIWGISESAAVAIGIFIFHLTSLALLLIVGVTYVVLHGPGQLWENLHTPTPNGALAALFFGFCAALLGISGFESSASFVEEQKPGVFPKTLRNMWAAVTILNPSMALLALSVIPLGEVAAHKEALLAEMGARTGGGWLATLISADAALVLSGAVLTSFVGVNGLIGRMTLDRCLPQFLLKRCRRGTTHRILITFFLLTVSVLWITRGELKELAGVYTLSFLSVMILFAVGNILLKVRRASLPRPSRAGWLTVVVGIIAVGAGLVGNAILNPEHLLVFAQYFLPTLLVVSIMLSRISLLRLVLHVIQAAIKAIVRPLTLTVSRVHEKIEEIQSQQMVFFTRGDNIANLNRVMLYIERNEHTSRLKVVHVTDHPDEVPEKLKQDLKFLDEAYPEIDIEFVVVPGKFGPELIRKLSKQWNIPTNLMFIGCPGEGMTHSLAALGGVRVII